MKGSLNHGGNPQSIANNNKGGHLYNSDHSSGVAPSHWTSGHQDPSSEQCEAKLLVTCCVKNPVGQRTFTTVLYAVCVELRIATSESGYGGQCISGNFIINAP